MAKNEKTKLTIVKDDKEEVKEVNKPTPEETAQFKAEFDEAVKTFNEAKWEISEKGNFGANDVGLFLLDFMKRFAFWSKMGWMGMLKINDELAKAMALSDASTGLCLDYQALEFTAYMLASPGATGYDSCVEFDKIAEKYSKIGIVVGQKIEEARARLKDVQYLQERWAASEQGFYLADLEPIVDASTNSEAEPKTIVMDARTKPETA